MRGKARRGRREEENEGGSSRRIVEQDRGKEEQRMTQMHQCQQFVLPLYYNSCWLLSATCIAFLLQSQQSIAFICGKQANICPSSVRHDNSLHELIPTLVLLHLLFLFCSFLSLLFSTSSILTTSPVHILSHFSFPCPT